ncbi:DsbE family thiol:disulfide interchange protein [Pokkaliibacter sp. CJK22405]|uniref:DsbE family thiol:disulfide interchange protein n=1 Tax=Pokkaliibacter sp. CJK22405 TaxID=3384615 RepID=UPI003984AA35
MRKLMFFLPLVIVIILGGFFWKSLGKDPSLLPSVLIDKPLPDFRLASLADSEKMLTPQSMPKKPYLLNVWGTWCPACRIEHPFFTQLAQSGVNIIGVNYKDERSSAEKWLSDLGNPYLMNIFDDKGTLGLDLGVYGAPETYLVDSQGVIRYKHVGIVSAEVWSKNIQPRYQQLLGEKAP